MEKNVILAGVGGQGILSIAYVIDHAALDAGCELKQAEVHGMAQRGGAVQSNLRYADHPIHSDLVPRGRVDLVLSVEPLEALRYVEFLAPGGWVVTSTTPYVNIGDYPEQQALLERLGRLERVVMVDSRKLASAAGNLKGQNIVMLGAAAPLLELSAELLVTHVRGLFARKGEAVQAANVRSFEVGRAAGLFFRGLVDAGMKPAAAHALQTTIDPARYGEDPAKFVPAQTR